MSSRKLKSRTFHTISHWLCPVCKRKISLEAGFESDGRQRHLRECVPIDLEQKWYPGDNGKKRRKWYE